MCCGDIHAKTINETYISKDKDSYIALSTQRGPFWMGSSKRGKIDVIVLWAFCLKKAPHYGLHRETLEIFHLWKIIEVKEKKIIFSFARYAGGFHLVHRRFCHFFYMLKRHAFWNCQVKYHVKHCWAAR